MKRLLAGVLTSMLLLVVYPSVSNAAVTSGSKCLKAGIKQVYKGKTYTCIKLGKKLYWNNGVRISAPAPTVTETAASSPTATKSLLPSTIKATIKFSGGATTRTAWGTGLSNLYCDIPQDAIIIPQIPNYAVANVNWSQTNMKLFDGAGKLLGIASSLPQYQHFNDGSCSVTFILNDLVLSQGPLTFRTGSAPNWIVPYSNWVGGEVLLSGDATVISY